MFYSLIVGVPRIPDIDLDEEDEDAIIERRRKEREALLRVL